MKRVSTATLLCAWSGAFAASLGTLQDPVVGLLDQEAPSEHSELAQTKPSENDRQTAQEKQDPTTSVFRSGGDIIPPALIYKVEPEYSAEARQARYQGTVLLYVQVDPSGKAINMRVLHSLGLGLDEKAMEAVKKWVFRPGMKNGNPVTVEAQIEVNFRLLPDFGVLLKRAKEGDVAAQFDLALMSELGQGVPQDYGVAFKWYRAAAGLGLPAAQNNLALMYENGVGVAQDYGLALKWYRRGADGGNAKAQASLGRLYEQGRGVAQDSGQALKWYRKAAEQGVTGAQFYLGGIYSDGRAVPQDHSQALKYYLMAAKQGLPAAQYAVGSLFAKGQGAQQDRVAAHMWFELAGRGPDVEVSKLAATGRAAMATLMTREEIDEARRLAREWHAKKP